MVEFPAIPIRFHYTGDEEKAKTLKGLGHKRYTDLVTAMGWRGLETGFNNLEMPGGVTIHTSKNYGLSTISIHVPKIAEDELLPEEDKFADLRFFIRVGSLEDVVLDELTGWVIEDNTRYYWIDFFSGEGGNDIYFYGQGQAISSGLNEDGTKTINKFAPKASRGDMLHICDPPPYMDDYAAKAFDLPYQDESGQDRTQRFVGGYHYLSKNRKMVYDPNPNKLPMPGGCQMDLDLMTTKCPPNRFFYDLESGTVAWYHVTQEWEGFDGGSPDHSESTGAIGGIVIGIDFESEWLIDQIGSISVNGDDSEAFGFAAGPWDDAIYNPVGVMADIIALNREDAILHVPYQHQLFEFTLSGDGVFAQESCEILSEAQSLYWSLDGVREIQSAAFADEGEDAVNVPEPAYDIDNNYTCQSCVDAPVETCASDWCLQTDGWTYQRRYFEWWGIYSDLFLPEMEDDPYSWVQAEKGKNGGDEVEGVECASKMCYWSLGACRTNSGNNNVTKTIVGWISGYYGTKPTVELTAHNIIRTTQITKAAQNVAMARNNTLSSRSTLPYLNENPEFADSLEEWIEIGNHEPTVMKGTTPTTADSVYDTPWPKGYLLRDPIDMIYRHDAYPFDMPAMTYSTDIGGAHHWKYEISSYDNSENEYPNTLKIVGITQEFASSNGFNVRYLDDRSTEGSHGLVVYVESPAPGNRALLHGGTVTDPGATPVDRLQDVLTQLETQGLLGEDDFIYDVGLL